MDIAIIGNGVIGSHIYNQLNYWNNDEYNIDNDYFLNIKMYGKYEMKDLETNMDDINLFILTTRMDNVHELPIIGTKTPVLTTIKGIYHNKKVSDYFNNIVVMSGYYTPSMFTPTFIYDRVEDFRKIKNIFPPTISNRNLKEYTSKALEINYLKNMYLIIYDMCGIYEITKDISTIKSINDKLATILLEDIILCVREKSRNYIAGVELNKGKLVDNFYKLEGVTSFICSDYYSSSLLREMRGKVLSKIIGVERFGSQTTLEF